MDIVWDYSAGKIVTTLGQMRIAAVLTDVSLRFDHESLVPGVAYILVGIYEICRVSDSEPFRQKARNGYPRRIRSKGKKKC